MLLFCTYISISCFYVELEGKWKLMEASSSGHFVLNVNGSYERDELIGSALLWSAILMLPLRHKMAASSC